MLTWTGFEIVPIGSYRFCALDPEEAKGEGKPVRFKDKESEKTLISERQRKRLVEILPLPLLLLLFSCCCCFSFFHSGNVRLEGVLRSLCKFVAELFLVSSFAGPQSSVLFFIKK